MRRNASRWRTPLARWIRDYGTRRLSSALARRGHPVSQLAVYHWVAGRNCPRIEHARAIVRLSHNALRLDDIYAVRRRRAGSVPPPRPPRAGTEVAPPC